MRTSRTVICDIEATGLHEDKDMIEIALITVIDGKVHEVYQTLINPEVEISPFVRELTGITQRELQAAPKFHEVAESIRLRVEGSLFVSHNTAFDLGLLKKKFLERGEELKLRSLCTLRLAEELIPGLTNYNLDALCSFFGVKIRDRHRALGDAEATWEIFRELSSLRASERETPLWLPQHERILRKLPKLAGLLELMGEDREVIRREATDDLQGRSRSLLVVNHKNRDLIRRTRDIRWEPTGSPLIAEFIKLHRTPSRYHWMVGHMPDSSGELAFVVRPYRKGDEGIWFFQHQDLARRKCRDLNRKLRETKFLYQEGGRSKEEILRTNQRARELSRTELFPTPHLIVFGSGRTLGERSVILVKDGHVRGYGYSELSEAEILRNPEAVLEKEYDRHLGVDLAARKYLRGLKNQRHKTERWQGLSVKTVVERAHEPKAI